MTGRAILILGLAAMSALGEERAREGTRKGTLGLGKGLPFPTQNGFFASAARTCAVTHTGVVTYCDE